MKVLVVDCRERRDALVALVGRDRCEGKAQVWELAGETTTPADWDTIANRASLPADTDIVFLHASDAQVVRIWQPFLEKRCDGKWVVLYGGDGITKDRLENINFDTKLLDQHSKWHAYEQEVKASTRAEWNPGAFVDAVQAGKIESEAFACLLPFDPKFEAKLNLLYACLDQQSLDHFLADQADPYGWSAISSLQIPWSGDKTESISRVLFEENNKIRRVQDIDLRKLRDGLLGC